jgi:hypothetical protein
MRRLRVTLSPKGERAMSRIMQNRKRRSLLGYPDK